jgi:CHAT domain-containing protein
VAMPTTPGVDGRLDFVPAEADRLLGLLPEPTLLTEPDAPDPGSAPAGPLPTRENVLKLLSSCTIAHFACHGISDSADPSRSRLLLHDHVTDPLTVAALAPIRFDHARLAYLSACETALTRDTRLVDEAINLATAFQLAGYSHVIGTLWAVDDDATVLRIAETFYSGLRATGPDATIAVGRAARSLHDAVRAVRRRFPAAPSLWAAHLHAGA